MGHVGGSPETRKGPTRRREFVSLIAQWLEIQIDGVYRLMPVRHQPIEPIWEEHTMAFKPNYRRDRLERDRAARARSEEKQKKKEERTAQRKSEQAASEVPSEGEKD
jgi:hypothetical protein